MAYSSERCGECNEVITYNLADDKGYLYAIHYHNHRGHGHRTANCDWCNPGWRQQDWARAAHH